MDEYLRQGREIIQPNLVYNGFGSIHKVILLMVKEIEDKEEQYMGNSKDKGVRRFLSIVIAIIVIFLVGRAIFSYSDQVNEVNSQNYANCIQRALAQGTSTSECK